MIVTGTLDPRPVHVRLTADTSSFDLYIAKTARWLVELDVKREIVGLSPAGAWALFYTRGAMDSDFATTDAVDQYLRVLTHIGGALGHAARTGFLAGWAEHRSAVA